MSDLEQVNIRLSELESRIDLLEQAKFDELERQMLAPPIDRSAAVADGAWPPPELKSRESSNSSVGEEGTIKATEIRRPKKTNGKKKSGLLLKFTVPDVILDDVFLIKVKNHIVLVSSSGLKSGEDASFMIATDDKDKPIFADEIVVANMLNDPPVSELEDRLNKLKRGGSKRNKIQKKRSTRKKTDYWF